MPLKRSWVGGANDPSGPFPLNNLPFGVFDDGLGTRVGVAIGDYVLDLGAMEGLSMVPAAGFRTGTLNAFMATGPGLWDRVRNTLTGLLADGSPAETQLAPLLLPEAMVTLQMPFEVAEYTDFYAGRHHATNVGAMFRGAENALPPNWLHIPIGYNGRASSVVVSGTDVRRPWGQLKSPDFDAPIFAPSRRFDIELEMGAVVGQSSTGPVSVRDADDMIFGYVLLNDWSARDHPGLGISAIGSVSSKGRCNDHQSLGCHAGRTGTLPRRRSGA